MFIGAVQPDSMLSMKYRYVQTQAPVRSHDTTEASTARNVDVWLQSGVKLVLVARHSEVFLTCQMSHGHPHSIHVLDYGVTNHSSRSFVLGHWELRQTDRSALLRSACPTVMYENKTTKGKTFGQNNQ